MIRLLTVTRAQTHAQPIAGAPTHASERGDRALARLPFYPLLLAAWPVLRLYGDNTNEFAIGDLVLPLAVCARSGGRGAHGPDDHLA